jgi:hypothetical protein
MRTLFSLSTIPLLLALTFSSSVFAAESVGRDGEPLPNPLDWSLQNGQSCFETSGTPGCADAVCEASVCSYDPFCCDVAWDGLCVAEAENDQNCGDVVTDISNFRIEVSKVFSDGNTASVDVTLECDDGFVSQDGTATISAGAPHTFVVTEADYGVSCRVTEQVPSNYTASYLANSRQTDSTECLFVASPPPEVEAAGGKGKLLDDHAVDIGDDNTCEITNSADDGTFSVTKVWDTLGDADSVIDRDVVLSIDCTSDISNPSPLPCTSQEDSTECTWEIDWDGEGLGDSVTAMVDVDTTTGDAYCTATEQLAAGDTVESSSDCTIRMKVSAGGSNGCTITNTVFFEGIPTLSQYGLAILALLMLSVGYVGFRRFA